MNLEEKISIRIGKKLFCCLGEQIQDFVGVKHNSSLTSRYLDKNTIACIVYVKLKHSIGFIDSIKHSVHKKLQSYDFKRKN